MVGMALWVLLFRLTYLGLLWFRICFVIGVTGEKVFLWMLGCEWVRVVGVLFGVVSLVLVDLEL